jgi:hypothetical protein
MSTELRRSAITRMIPHRRFRPVTPAGPGPSAGLYAGESENCRRDCRAFLIVMVEFALILALFDAYRVETRAFRCLMLLAAASLPVHFVAHFRWKRPIFVAVSIIGMVVVNGPSISAVVLAVSAVLIGLAEAPFRWGTRAVLIAAMGIGMAVLRSRAPVAAQSIPTGIIPVIATMFMFRLIIYMYEQKHAKSKTNLVDTVSYFFVLPNYVFPHFPVIDFRAFQRGYFIRGIHEIQRAGLAMMWRGTVHLLLYRLIDRLLLISPTAVHDPVSLASYLTFNYLLYLRVSGQFHVACGLLHLFGFQLPETHRGYFLAAGFTDYWRRINIYWKDFMVLIVFNPVVFRLKRWPRPAALAAATTVVFVATWLLHAYQSFWLRGVCGFSAPDALFWAILGVLVMINVQLDALRPPRRSQNSLGSPSRLALQSMKVAATFVTIALLWSLWSSSSVEAWIGMLRRGLLL